MKKETLKLSKLGKNENVLLYTISSAESELQVCQIINRVFGISFSLADDLMIAIKNSLVGFKKYYFENEDGIEKYLLIVNRNQNNYLFPELKKIDYIFIILSESLSADFGDLIQQLKLNAGILAVFNVDTSSLKSFHRIQF